MIRIRMRKWGGVTAGRRPAPSSLISLSVACLHSPAPSGSQEQNQGVETQDMRSDRECDMRYLSPPRRRRQSGARRGRRSHSLSPLRRRGWGRREQKKMNAVPHARERALPRIDQASSPGNRSASSPRTMKQDVAALAAIVHARQRQPCIETSQSSTGCASSRARGAS